MICSICSHVIEKDPAGWDKGHNPFPIQNDGRCCEECNNELVIPARLTIALGMTIKESRQLVKEYNIE